MPKSKQPRKYQLDTSKFLKLMKDKHITCLDLQVYCNVYPETFKRFKENNGNITVNTLMKLVEGVEEILGEEFGNKFKYFEMKEKKKKK